jgi:hypothetical protein
VLGLRLILKLMPVANEAREEIRGHRALRGLFPVPRLLGHLRIPGGRLLLYQRFGPDEPDEGLFLDLLNAADAAETNQGGFDELDVYLADLTSAYRGAILATARPLQPADIVRKLYWDRAALGGRLDDYYADHDFLVADGLVDLPVSDLGDYALVVNGHECRLEWAKTLARLRDWADDTTSMWCAVTQGDPTDVNLAVPFTVFDYDTGGFNAVAGEFANFCWYTAHLGGYLVPKYNPDAFADHKRTFDHVGGNAPLLRRVDVDRVRRTIRVDLDWRPSLARRRALTAYLDDVVEPLRSPFFADRLDACVQPFLALRILGVYSLADLAPLDRLAMLTCLARCEAPDFTLRGFFDLEGP